MRLSEAIVEDILRVLDDPECATHEKLTQLAQDFERACSRFNQLEATVCAALDVGSLAEAARVAKNEKLLNEYQTLNFDQLEDWRDACRALGLPVSPPLSSSNVARIDDFLEFYGKHEALFARRRYLALIGADALSQLKVVRDLQLVFPDCPIWDSQIRMLEALNEREIQAWYEREDDKLQSLWSQDTEEAANRKKETLGKLQEILATLESPERLEPASPEFLRKLRVTSRKLEQQIAFYEMTEAYAEWREALKVQRADLPAFGDALAKAYLKCQQLKINVPSRYSPQEFEKAGLAQKYHNALESFKEKLTRFRNLLQNNDATLEEQTAAYKAVELAYEILQTAANNAAGVVQNCEIPSIDQDLVDDYEARVDAVERQKLRIRVLCVSAAVLFCALLSVAVFFIARQKHFNNEALAVAAALEVQLDSFERKTDYAALSKVEKTLEGYYVVKSPITKRLAFIEQAERCQKLRDAEDERRARFQDDVEKLQAIHKTEKTRPDLLQRVKDAAFTAEEKKEYQTLKKREDEIRKSNTDAYLQRLDSLVDQKNALAKTQISDLETRLANIQELQDELQKLDQEFDASAISPRAKEQGDNFKSSLADWRATTELSLKLQGAVGDAKEFETTLTRYQDNISEDAYARALDALQLVPAFDAWNDFAQTDAKSGAWTQTAENFKSRQTSLAPALNTLSEFLPEINDVNARFQTLSKRQELTQELKRVFKFCQPELYVFADLKNTVYYYLTSTPTIASKKSSVEYCVQIVDGVPKTQVFDTDIIESSQFASIERAPQYVLYQKIQKLPAVPADSDWFDFVEDVVDTLIVKADEQTLDPAAQAVLLKRLASVLSQDPDLEFFEEWQTALDDVDVGVNLYESTQALRKLRETASDVLPQLKVASAETGLRNARKSAQNLDRSLASLAPCRWVGFVDVADSTARLASNDDATLEDGTLYIAEVVDNSVKARVFGKVQNGQATVTPRVDFKSQRWNLVFLRSNAANSSPSPKEASLASAAPRSL